MATFVGGLTAKDEQAAKKIEEILHQEQAYGIDRDGTDFELNGDVDASSFTFGDNDPLLQKLIPCLAEGWINICDDDWLAGELQLDWQFERCKFDPKQRIWRCQTAANVLDIRDILSSVDDRAALEKDGSPDARRIEKQLFEGNVRVIGEKA